MNLEKENTKTDAANCKNFNINNLINLIFKKNYLNR